MESLYDKMRETALRFPNKTALVFYGKRFTFKEVLELTDRAAAGLKQMGIKKGRVVTICLPNTPAAQIAFYAINRLGAVANLVHPLIPQNSLVQALKKTRTSLLITYDSLTKQKPPVGRPTPEPRPLLSPDCPEYKALGIPVLKSNCDYYMGAIVKLYYKLFIKKKAPKMPYFESLFAFSPLTEPSSAFAALEPAVFLPSGGTGGTPKIIMHGCEAFNRICGEANFFLSEDLSLYDAMYTVLPIFHGFGLCMSMHMCAVVGVTNVMSMKFNAKQLARAVKKEKINVILGVPTMYSKLLNNKKFVRTNLSSVKDCFVGGDAVPSQLTESFDAVLKKQGSKAKLMTGYGLAETVAACTINNRQRYKKGSAGTPLPATRIKIIEDGEEQKSGESGEICINSPSLMLGYFEPEKLLEKHGKEKPPAPIRLIDGEPWLFTGDIGYVSGEGFLFFKNRMKNIIKVSGVPVFPAEIEETAQSVEGVRAAAAIGIADTNTSESVKLFIVPDDFSGDLEALREKILRALKGNLISYAIPKTIDFVREMPLSDIGKIDRKKLLNLD